MSKFILHHLGNTHKLSKHKLQIKCLLIVIFPSLHFTARIPNATKIYTSHTIFQITVYTLADPNYNTNTAHTLSTGMWLCKKWQQSFHCFFLMQSDYMSKNLLIQKHWNPWSILLIILLCSCWWGRAVTWTSRTRMGTHPSTRRSDTTPCLSSDSYRTCRMSARYQPPPTSVAQAINTNSLFWKKE